MTLSALGVVTRPASPATDLMAPPRRNAGDPYGIRQEATPTQRAEARRIAEEKARADALAAAWGQPTTATAQEITAGGGISRFALVGGAAILGVGALAAFLMWRKGK